MCTVCVYVCTCICRSPHLVEVRERIRINGQPLTKEDFTKYYWECHRKLSNDRVNHNQQCIVFFELVL